MDYLIILVLLYMHCVKVLMYRIHGQMYSDRFIANCMHPYSQPIGMLMLCMYSAGEPQ